MNRAVWQILDEVRSGKSGWNADQLAERLSEADPKPSPSDIWLLCCRLKEKPVGEPTNKPGGPFDPSNLLAHLDQFFGGRGPGATFANNYHRFRGGLSHPAKAETPAEPLDRRTGWCFSIVEHDSIVAGSRRYRPQWAVRLAGAPFQSDGGHNLGLEQSAGVESGERSAGLDLCRTLVLRQWNPARSDSHPCGSARRVGCNHLLPSDVRRR